MQILATLFFAAAAIAATAQNLSALSFDEFGEVPGVQVVSSGHYNQSFGYFDSKFALGGYRSVALNSGNGGSLSAVLGGGHLQYQQSLPYPDGLLMQLIWDGEDSVLLSPSGLAGVDFTADGANAFLVRLAALSHGAGATSGNSALRLLFRAYDAADSSGDTWSEGAIEITESPAWEAPANFHVHFSDASVSGPGGPVNWENVGAVTFAVSAVSKAGNSGVLSASFSYIGTSYVPQCSVGGSCVTGLAGICSAGKYNSLCDCVLDFTPEPEAYSEGACDGLDNDCDGEVDEIFDLCGRHCGNSSSCLGCDGVPASGKIIDDCGICGGDGTTCEGTVPAGCLEIDLSQQIALVNRDFFTLRDIYMRALRRYAKLVNSSTGATRVRQELQAASFRYNQIQLEFSAIVPAKVLSCPAAVTSCEQIEIAAVLQRLRDLAAQWQQGTVRAVTRSLRTGRGNKTDRKRKSRAKAVHQRVVGHIAELPAVFSICGQI